MEKYVLSVDQSTQGTKALIFDESGKMLCRCDKSHRQIVENEGWVSHDPEEIYSNLIACVNELIEKSGVPKEKIAAMGISNQRETSVAWNKETGKPVCHAIVWQCARAQKICERIEKNGCGDLIKSRTGIPVSPYFPAAKLSWIMENIPEARILSDSGKLCMGTVDTWLVYKLTHGKAYKTDYSNASRTSLFNLETLSWDSEICDIFGLRKENLAEVCDSDSVFGETNLEGLLDKKIPIHAVLGDSHAALFGQGCLERGMAKATYGTGSSIMMNIGASPVQSKSGLVTSLAWKYKGEVNFVLEGNVNYAGAVITWLLKDLKLISSPDETKELAQSANTEDSTYLVPAFTGLGAPYWNSNAKAAFVSMSRTTGRAELVKAALESIAYQITDIVKAMGNDTGIDLAELRVDGGPTKNEYLMQFQSDMLNTAVLCPSAQELSGIGAAYMAGLSCGVLTDEVFSLSGRTKFAPKTEKALREKKYEGWKKAIASVLEHS